MDVALTFSRVFARQDQSFTQNSQKHQILTSYLAMALDLMKNQRGFMPFIKSPLIMSVGLREVIRALTDFHCYGCSQLLLWSLMYFTSYILNLVASFNPLILAKIYKKIEKNKFFDRFFTSIFIFINITIPMIFFDLINHPHPH